MPVNKVIYGGTTLIDLTADTVNHSTLLSGVTAHDKRGNMIIGTITGIGTDTYTPSRSNQIIQCGQYLWGAQTIKGDSNLVAENIKKGVSIFGVKGTANVVDEVTELPTAGAENKNRLIIYNNILYICKEV